MKVQMLPKYEVKIECTNDEWYTIRQALITCHSLCKDKQMLGLVPILKSLVEDTDIEVIKENTI